MWYKVVKGLYIDSIGQGMGGIPISQEEYINLSEIISNHPLPPDEYTYKLRADNLKWELVKLPPIEHEPLTDEDALTRYANELTGENDPDLVSATETLIKKLTEE